MMSFTAVETLRAAADLDSSAIAQQFDDLMRENGAALNRLASGYAKSLSDRDDLVQEIALALWRALPRFRGDCSPRTFLFRIAHNRAMAWLAGRSGFVQVEDGDMVLRDPAPDPEAGYAREQRNQLLFGAIRRLPIAYRQVMILALEGLDYGEISQILGITESNAGVRLSRAKQALKKSLEGRL
jgi:RNA polymerase sigma-70 factor (ECF subfamily)